MQSEPTERLKAESSAKPKAVGFLVVIVVVLAVILAWVLGFFTWLLS